MSARINFKKGSMEEMLLLHELHSGGDCYGYQLSQLIKEISGGELNFPVGSLYPALYKLIDNKYITDYKKQAGKRLVRVYYHIEPSGEERLEVLKAEYYATHRSVQLVLEHDFSENVNEGDEEESE